MREGEDLDLAPAAANRMGAEADRPDADVPGEIGGEQEGAAEGLAQLLHPAGDVDRRANDGEVEPVATSDIAVSDLPDVQAAAEVERLLAALQSPFVARLERIARLKRRIQGSPAR